MRHRKRLIYASYIPALLMADGCALHENAAWADEAPAHVEKEPGRRTDKEQSVILDAQRAPAKDSVLTHTPRVGAPPPVFDDQATVPVVDAGKPLDDDQIVRVTHEISERQILAADQVARRATDPRLRRLGRDVGNTYKRTESKSERLSRNTDLSPKESATSAVVREESKRDTEKIGEAAGPELDLTLVDNQVELQRRTLQLIDERMLPTADDEQLRALLVQLRPTVDRQLRQAVDLQRKLHGAPKFKESTKTKE